MNRPVLFRIQDAEGRGPYKPGISRLWADATHGLRAGAAISIEFGPDVYDRVPAGVHAGCAFATLDQLHAWFSEAEIARLRVMGYRIVTVKADGIVAQSARQTVFWSRRPLCFAKPLETCAAA